MDSLIVVNDGQALTTSRMVADKFGKKHAHVLRKIRELDCSDAFNQSNFGLVEYTDAKGQSRPEYVMTKDGFVFLVMGFTGSEAARFKEEYIRAFNRIEERLRSGQLALANSRMDKLEAQLEQIAMDDYGTQVQVWRLEERVQDLERKNRILTQLCTTNGKHYTVREYAKRMALYLTGDEVMSISLTCKSLCNRHGIDHGFVSSDKFGRINTYPELVLSSAFAPWVG